MRIYNDKNCYRREFIFLVARQILRKESIVLIFEQMYVKLYLCNNK